MRNKKTPAGILSLAALVMLGGCGGGATSGDSPQANMSLAGATAISVAGDTQATPAASTFGVVQTTLYVTVDTGAGLVFKVRRSNGDISSIKYKGGPELQEQTKGSHLVSGLGSSTSVTWTVSAGVAKVTLTTPTVTHYLIAREGENTIYMGTNISAEPSAGELRWITRLESTAFNNVPVESNNTGSTGDIESGDVAGHADGRTTSKYYGNQRAMDLTLRGVTGPGIGVFMVYGNRESSSGGPFYRDIQNQSGENNTEVYNYMNSGHAQTEANRMGFHGPYALVFTDGATPSAQDMSWMESQSLAGWVSSGQRGKVSGRGLYGFDLAHTYTVGFANAEAQYWTVARAPNGNFTTPLMKPGSYTMTVYKDEYALNSSVVNVDSGGTTTLAPITLSGDPDKAAALWRIGTWDGTPKEFLNGTSINLRHPSDVRNASWGPVTHAVGAPANSFPAAQWKTGVNTPTTVTFVLTPEQVKNHTLRIGITTAFAGGRPSVKINGWSSAIPAPSSQPDSRTITVGNYRGKNAMFTYAVPASAFVAGTNSMTINVSSGSSGNAFLSPSFAFDALDML